MDQKKLRKIMSDAQKVYDTNPFDVAKKVLTDMGYEVQGEYLVKKNKIVGTYEGLNEDGFPLIHLRVPREEVDKGLPPDMLIVKKSFGVVKMPPFMFFTKEQTVEQLNELRLIYDFGNIIRY